MSYDSMVRRDIEESVAEALNENDIELIQWIEKFRDKNSFGDGKSSESIAVTNAFKFACDEIIKHINESE